MADEFINPNVVQVNDKGEVGPNIAQNGAVGSIKTLPPPLTVVVAVVGTPVKNFPYQIFGTRRMDGEMDESFSVTAIYTGDRNIDGDAIFREMDPR